MSISTLQRQTSALLICALLTIPGLATAQEDEPMTATSPQNSQQGGMSNHMGMDHKGMMNHKGMMDKKDGMKNKADSKANPKTTEPNDNSNTSMPMKNDM